VEKVVSVRESAESFDDVPVLNGVVEKIYTHVQEARGGGGFEVVKEFKTAFLMRETLGVFEGEIEKDFLEKPQFKVFVIVECFDREREGEGVVGKGLGCGPMDVSRKLVEDDYQRESALRRRRPLIEVALLSGVEEIPKLPLDVVVGRGGMPPPQRALGLSLFERVSIEVPKPVVKYSFMSVHDSHVLAAWPTRRKRRARTDCSMGRNRGGGGGNGVVRV